MISLFSGSQVFAQHIDVGTIIVEKQTLPDGDPTQFTFTGDAAGMISDGQTIVVSNLMPGTYTSTEIVPAGWDLTSIVCDDQQGTTPSSGDLQQNKATFKLEADETVTCTFTNTKRGNIVIIKDTVPNNTQDFKFTTTGGLSPSSFKLDDDSDPTLSNIRQFSNILPGSYTVTETAVPGFRTTVLCADPNDSSGPSRPEFANTNVATIGLDAGETVTCTFTNEKVIKLTVIKLLKQPSGIITKLQNAQVTIINSDGEQVASGNTGANGSVTFNLPPGTYTVKINPPSTAPAGCTFVPETDSVKVKLVSISQTIKVINTIVCPQPGPAKIIVQKFLDVDQDGIGDGDHDGTGDEPLQGVKLVLLNSLGNEVGRGVTDANGIVVFDPIAGQNTQFTIDEPDQVLPGGCEITDKKVISGSTLLPLPHTVTVSAGQTTTIQILNQIECTKIPLIVMKFLDSNKNGMKDSGESAPPNNFIFTIQVFDQTGFTLIAEEETSNGQAMFDLPPGTYIVREGKFPEAPDNCAWFQTFPGPTEKLQHKITLSTADPTIEFGNFLKCPEPTGMGRIQVIKFQDDNKDGVRNQVCDQSIPPNCSFTEAALSGWEIQVFDSTGTTLVASGVTDSNGHVQFDVPNGIYIVRETFPPVPDTCIGGGWVQTTPLSPNFHKVNVLIGSDQTVTFGNVLVCDAIGHKVVVTKFSDKNGNKQRDLAPFAEPVLKGFLIKVYDSSDLTTPLKKVVTDSQGMATFILPAGSYVIRENIFGVVPLDCRAGQWTQTFPGPSKSFQHEVTITGSSPAVITLNDNGKPLQFGNKLSCFAAPAKLVVNKFFDKNRDGMKNGSESGLKGFTIWVFDNQMQLVAKGTTNKQGSVTFNLPAGTYKVFEEFRLVMPNECQGGVWVQTSPGPENFQQSPSMDIDELAENSITVPLLSGSAARIKFGNVLDCPPQLDP